MSRASYMCAFVCFFLLEAVVVKRHFCIACTILGTMFLIDPERLGGGGGFDPQCRAIFTILYDCDVWHTQTTRRVTQRLDIRRAARRATCTGAFFTRAG